MLFYNGGAKLTVEGSESLEDLKGLEAQGIEVKGSELTMVPTTPTDVSVVDAKNCLLYTSRCV